MEPAPERLVTKPSWLITQTAVYAQRVVSEAFASAGARGYHYRVLATLQEFGPASQAEVGRRCRMDRSDVVAAVTELEGAAFAERGTDPADRRRNTVTITEAGVRQLHRLDRSLDRAQDTLLVPLTVDERHALIGLLRKVVDHHAGSADDAPDRERVSRSARPERR